MKASRPDPAEVSRRAAACYDVNFVIDAYQALFDKVARNAPHPGG
jgi:hypothetical protein